MNSTGPPVVQHRPVRRQVGVAGLARLRVRLGPGALVGHQPAEPLLVDAAAPAPPRSPGSGRSGSRTCRAAGTPCSPDSAGLPADFWSPRSRCPGSSCPPAAWTGTPPPPRTRTRRSGRSRSASSGYDGAMQSRATGSSSGSAGALPAQQPHRPDRPAHDPAQHVAAALVGRGHPVADQHQRGAHVVGDHPQPHVVGVRLAAPRARSARRTACRSAPPPGPGSGATSSISYRLSTPCRIDGHPLQAHAGVDVLAPAGHRGSGSPPCRCPVPVSYCMKTRFQNSM